MPPGRRVEVVGLALAPLSDFKLPPNMPRYTGRERLEPFAMPQSARGTRAAESQTRDQACE